jgi:hypothetical protein
MTQRPDSRPPIWAKRNAKKAIGLMDGTPAYVSLYKVRAMEGRLINKRLLEARLKPYFPRMQDQGRILMMGSNKFIAPCWGTFMTSSGGEYERNVMLCDIGYKIQRSGVVISNRPFLTIPIHAFARVFERDLRPPAEVAKAFMSKAFIQSVLELVELSYIEQSDSGFAIRFLNGFLTGTIREMTMGTDLFETKVLDVRTFLHRDQKPLWVRNTEQKPYATFKYTDRRGTVTDAERAAELLEGLEISKTYEFEASHPTSSIAPVS